MRQSAPGLPLGGTLPRRVPPDAFQPFERNGQISAAFVPGERMQFVDDDKRTFSKMRSITFLREHNGETFRCGNEEVCRLPPELRAFCRGGIASAQMHEQLFFKPMPAMGACKFFRMS